MLRLNNLFFLSLASTTIVFAIFLLPTRAENSNVTDSENAGNTGNTAKSKSPNNSTNNSTNSSPNNSNNPSKKSVLQEIKQLYPKLEQSVEQPIQQFIEKPIQESIQEQIQQPIQSLANDINQGIQGLTQEIQAQINNAINKSVGTLGIPDIVKAGVEIKKVIAGTPTDILQVNAHIQGKNAEQTFHQQQTIAQSREVLGLDGQQKMKQENEATQKAVDIALSSGETAQNDIVTQDVMKKIALQNAQTATILQSVQTSLQEQNKLTATANVNLSDISQNLSAEQHRKQNEEQGITNAIYRNAALADGFWSSKHDPNKH